jgi:hypothetical protein
VAPSVADRYLADNGYEAQQTDKPIEPYRSDNLFHPLPGDHGAHGEFDDVAHDRSTEFFLSKHRTSLLAATAVLLTGAGLVRKLLA